MYSSEEPDLLTPGEPDHFSVVFSCISNVLCFAGYGLWTFKCQHLPFDTDTDPVVQR